MSGDLSTPLAHGGDLDLIRQRFPDATEPWLDLSTGINPQAYPIGELRPDLWSRLPLASDEMALREAAAACYGAADGAMIVAAPGTQALIQIVPRLITHGHVAVVGPTYGEHIRSWSREGHVAHDAPTLGDAAGADVVVVVNPDNPTGRICSRAELADCAQTLRGRGGLLVVDEAFMDVIEPDHSLVPDLPAGCVVLRSFGKAYGLGGLRLGFAISSVATAARLRALLGPWAVSGPALEIGRRALDDRSWLASARQRLRTDSRRLDSLLQRAGCAIVGGTPLFRLTAHPRAGALADTLATKAIHVRRFAHQPTWLRLGLPGTPADWRRLENALTCAPQG